MPTTRGALAVAEATAKSNAKVVNNLLTTGIIVAVGYSTPTRSSSGSAVGVTAGFAPFSLGTESDGSIRMPAARAGLFTIKIIRATVNDVGIQPAFREFDCFGALTRDTLDQAHPVAIMQERDPNTYLPV
ncbi:amidase signature domain-containing protein [Dendryphion nanum]|uniref:Amidase signature domain-containing protein n=1 Tax=Dendryphion nanum TaxID=256645 RepID=A0A9P9D5H1_9PLEO|nr:amidase signature domain-containing protein [Dendryphion nanum]